MRFAQALALHGPIVSTLFATFYLIAVQQTVQDSEIANINK